MKEGDFFSTWSDFDAAVKSWCEGKGLHRKVRRSRPFQGSESKGLPEDIISQPKNKIIWAHDATKPGLKELWEFYASWERPQGGIVVKQIKRRTDVDPIIKRPYKGGVGVDAPSPTTPVTPIVPTASPKLVALSGRGRVKQPQAAAAAPQSASSKRQRIRPPHSSTSGQAGTSESSPLNFSSRHQRASSSTKAIASHISRCSGDEFETKLSKMQDLLKIWRDGFDFLLVRVPHGTVLLQQGCPSVLIESDDAQNSGGEIIPSMDSADTSNPSNSDRPSHDHRRTRTRRSEALSASRLKVERRDVKASPAS